MGVLPIGALHQVGDARCAGLAVRARSVGEAKGRRARGADEAAAARHGNEHCDLGSNRRISAAVLCAHFVVVAAVAAAAADARAGRRAAAAVLGNGRRAAERIAEDGEARRKLRTMDAASRRPLNQEILRNGMSAISAAVRRFFSAPRGLLLRTGAAPAAAAAARRDHGLGAATARTARNKRRRRV